MGFYSHLFTSLLAMGKRLLILSQSLLPVAASVKIFAKVPYHQPYYDTGCLDEESLGMDRVADYGISGDGCFVGMLAAAEMF